MSKSDLLVMDEMAANNQDIRCTTTLLDVQAVKQGATIKFGIDGPPGQRIMAGIVNNAEDQLICIAYVINKKQFFEIKNCQTLNPVCAANEDRIELKTVQSIELLSNYETHLKENYQIEIPEEAMVKFLEQ